MNRIWNRMATLITLGMLAGTTLADEGRIPLWEPTTITQSGSYVVTRDIDATGTGLIAIDLAPGIDAKIDLNGYTLTADSLLPAFRAVEFESVVLSNGAIVHGGGVPGSGGVHLTDGGAATLQDLTISQFTGGVGRSAILDNVRQYLVQRVHQRYEGATSGGCLRTTNGGIGTIEFTSCETTGNGISVSGGQSVILRDNVLRGGSFFGLRVDGNSVNAVLERNTVVGFNNALGVADVVNCRMTGNLVHGSNGAGIALGRANGCHVVGNTSSSNGGSGIVLTDSDRNVLRDNAAENNALAGIEINGASQDNILSGNVARGNQAAPAACAVGLVETCPAPLGGGSSVPDLCVDGIDNVSACDNLLPGPPAS